MSDDLKAKAAKAGEVIGDAATAAAARGAALAGQAGSALSGLFRSAKEKVEELTSGNDELKTTTITLADAVDAYVTARATGDDTKEALIAMTKAAKAAREAVAKE